MLKLFVGHLNTYELLMDTNIPGMEVISLINFNNFLNGYMTANEIKANCVFVVPTKFATSPQKELVRAGEVTKTIPRDN